MDLSLEMKDYAKFVDAAAKEYLTRAKHKHTGDLHKAMDYAMFPGGKRLRPLTLIGSCIGAGGEIDDALPFACALEMIQAYSLIHDDLPAMDNSDTRRGKPSCHIRFGEATAILAGDGLLNLAYEIMLGVCGSFETVKASRIIAEAAGVGGMVGGQAADMFYENTKTAAKITEEGLLYIHSHKTASMFGAAAYAGAVLGGSSDTEALLFRDAWQSLGIAFQIKDDIDNETGDAAVLGKPVKSDSKKNTYVSVFGMEKALADMENYVSKAQGFLTGLCGEKAFITLLAGVIVD